MSRIPCATMSSPLSESLNCTSGWIFLQQFFLYHFFKFHSNLSLLHNIAEHGETAAERVVLVPQIVHIRSVEFPAGGRHAWVELAVRLYPRFSESFHLKNQKGLNDTDSVLLLVCIFWWRREEKMGTNLAIRNSSIDVCRNGHHLRIGWKRLLMGLVSSTRVRGRWK